MKIDSDQFFMSRLLIIAYRALLFDYPETTGFEHVHQFAKPQSAVSPFQSTANADRPRYPFVISFSLPLPAFRRKLKV